MKVGEDGLVPRMGAEFMALETTAEAGTCLACRSMLGLVGSSAGMEGVVGEGGRKLNLPVPTPSLASGPRPHSQGPSSLQGPADNMPTAKGAHQPDGYYRGSAPAFPSTPRAPRQGVEPPFLDHTPEGRGCVSPTRLGASGG